MTTERTSAPEPSRRALYSAYAAGMTANALSTMVKLIIPLWAVHLQMSPVMIGIAIGALGAMPFLFAIHGGVLMDRFGTRRVNVAFAVIATVAMALYPMMPFASALIALQLLAGMPVNMAWMGAQTLIAQSAPGNTTLVGRFSVAARVGNLAAPILIGVVWDFAGPWWSFMMISATAFTTLICFLTAPALPDSDVGSTPVSARDLLPRVSDYVQAFSMLAVPAIAFTVVIAFLRITSAAIQGSFYVVYLEHIGIIGTLIGILIALGEVAGLYGAMIAGRVEARFTPHWTALFFIALSLFFVCLTPYLGGLLVLLGAASVMRGFGQGLSQPVMFSILSRAVSHEEQGRSIGLRTTSNRLSTMGMPPLMGLVVEFVGLDTSFAVMGFVMIGLCGVTALVVKRIPGFKT